MKITETNLKFTKTLIPRSSTKQLVIHHTGDQTHSDPSAKQIHQAHINQGFVGIGYNYLIRWDGTIERGRPEHTIGAHTLGYNDSSIGIALSGNFVISKPTQEQLEALSWLVEQVKTRYPNITIARHKDLAQTLCPGNIPWPIVNKKEGKPLSTKIPDWAAPSYARMRAKGIFAGDAQGNANPNEPVTEARFVVFMDRLDQRHDLDDKIKTLYNKYKSSFVTIYCKTARENWNPSEWLGSGSFLTEDGYILTNKHVTDFADFITVDTVWGKLPGKLVVNAGSMMVDDSSVDLAIIKVNLPTGKKPTLIPWTWNQPAKGNFNIVVGAPYGQTGSITFGIVSRSGVDEWVQIDTPINPGNSGGICILVDDGTAFGVPTWIVRNSDGMGFLTPNSTVKKFLQEKFPQGLRW